MKPQVLVLDQFGGKGGGQRVLADWVRVCKQSGWDVVAAIPTGGHLEKQLTSLGARVFDLPELNLNQGEKTYFDKIKILKHLLYLPKLIKQAKKSRLILVNGLRLIPIAFIISRLVPQLPILFYVHLEFSSNQKKLLSKVLSKCEKALAIVPSEFIQLGLQDYVPSNRILVIPNALSEDFARCEFRKPSAFGKNLKFISIGRLSKEKGHDLILKLANEFPDHQFFIATTDDNMDLLKEHSPISANVIIHPMVDNIPEFIRENNISASLMPSRVSESFGLAAIEAMACSCATIVSGRGGLGEIARRTGAAVAEDYESLKEQISRLIILCQEDLANECLNQFEKVMATYSPHNFAEVIREKILRRYQ